MPYRGNNYSFVIDSSFQPFSMQEMLVPFTAYKDAFEKTEAAYSDLQTKANIWDGLASEENDPETYEQYRKYATDLRKQAEDLSKRGLNMVNRSELMDLKRRYASEIVPIEQAYATRKAQADEQRKALLQNPTLLLSRRADMTSLDDYLRNPQLSYESYNGALLTQQVGQAASAIAKSLTDYSNGKPLDKFTQTWLQQHGYSPAKVLQAINNPNSSQSSQVLNAIVDNVVADSGISRWADNSTLQQAYGWARQGLWNAVGQTEIKPYENYGERLNAKYNKIAGANGNNSGNPLQRRPQLIPRALRSSQEVDASTNKFLTYQAMGYIKKGVNGNYELTPAGRKAYEEKVEYAHTYPNPRYAANVGGFTSPISNTGGQKGPSKFRQYIDELNGGQSLYDENGVFDWNLGDRVVSNVGEKGMYDTYHSTEYIRQVPETYAKEIKRQVMTEPDVLEELSFNGRNGWDTKPIEKSKLKDFSPTRTTYSKYGMTIEWVDKDGNSIRTNAPTGVNERITTEVAEAMDRADLYRQIIDAGKMPDTDANNVPIVKDGKVQFTDFPLTDRQKAAYINEWNDVMDAMSVLGSMYVAPSATPTTNYSSYEYGTPIGAYFDDDETSETE